MEGRSTASDDAVIAAAEEPSGSSNNRRTLIILLAVGLLLLFLGGLLVVVNALVQNPETAEALRDMVIVLIGIESLVTGVAVIVLIVQVARLTALLQNELRPMLEATNETLSTVRGTTEFLSDNMVRPVVRLGGAAAALRRAIELVGLGRVR